MKYQTIAIDKPVITLAAVGDIMLGDHPVRLGHGVRSIINQYGGDYIFAKVRERLRLADLTIGNLEVVLSDQGLNAEKLSSLEFRGMPSSVQALANAGFNILSVANNHMMEHGKEAFEETLALLRHRKISPLGVWDEANKSRPVTVQTRTMKVVFTGYSLRPENYYSGKVPYALADPQQIIAEVKELGQTADALVVSLHWGEEYIHYPSAAQISFAHELVDNGAKLILGHHPHVLQGIEEYHGSLIVYSLGNFVFDMWQDYTRESMLLSLELSTGGIKYEAVPVYINEQCQPVLIKGEHRNILSKKLTAYSAKISQLKATFPDEQDYLQQVRANNYHYRLECYRYFFRNIFRYKPSVLAQSLARFIKRRLEEFPLPRLSQKS